MATCTLHFSSLASQVFQLVNHHESAVSSLSREDLEPLDLFFELVNAGKSKIERKKIDDAVTKLMESIIPWWQHQSPVKSDRFDASEQFF